MSSIPDSEKARVGILIFDNVEVLDSPVRSRSSREPASSPALTPAAARRALLCGQDVADETARYIEYRR
jgi:hypothetical protein